MAEFTDLSKYIDKIEKEDQAHLAGIAKIIPPDDWIPRKQGEKDTFHSHIILTIFLYYRIRHRYSGLHHRISNPSELFSTQ